MKTLRSPWNQNLAPPDPSDVLVILVDAAKMARSAHGGGEYPSIRLFEVSAADLEDLEQLPADGELQWFPRLRLVHAENAAIEIETLPSQRDDLAQAHSRVDPYHEDISVRRG